MAFAPDLQMWLTFIVIGVTVVLYATERLPIEVVSLGSMVTLILIFTAFPVAGDGAIGPSDLLAGFANPALITVLSLLVVGQALFHTDALEKPARLVARMARGHRVVAFVVLIAGAGAISAFLNNTPVVVMALPVITSIAAKQGESASRVLMPLSFMTILGGMTTLIGSSTNLLVAGVAARSDAVDLSFFSFTPVAAAMAVVGGIYVLTVMPRLLEPRQNMAEQLKNLSGKQFIAQIEIGVGHPLVGHKAVAGLFPALKDMTVRLVQRGDRPILPPFENTMLQCGDTVIVAATRSTLTEALSDRSSIIIRETAAEDGEDDTARAEDELTLAEAVIAPGSRLIGRTLTNSGLHSDTACVVLGIQRRSRMPRMAMRDIRLESGDVLLFAGQRTDIEGLRTSHDVILMEWSAAEVPQRRFARRALAIFAAVVIAAATGMVPIVTAAITGALAMIGTRCLNIRQASRALDGRIIMLIAASLASATALEATGGATTIATALVTAMDGQSPTVLLSGLFLLIALLTNLLSNNATAVLFAPIAIGIAAKAGLPAEPFVVAVILAANCSFATPIGYQTNLLVMGPGHYRFADFIKAGIPLILLMWVAFTVVAPLYYGF